MSASYPVSPARLMGVPHREFGEAVVAVLVASSNAALEEAAVIRVFEGKARGLRQPLTQGAVTVVNDPGIWPVDRPNPYDQYDHMD